MEPSSTAGRHGTNVHNQSALSEEVSVPSDMEKVTMMEKEFETISRGWLNLQFHLVSAQLLL